MHGSTKKGGSALAASESDGRADAIHRGPRRRPVLDDRALCPLRNLPGYRLQVARTLRRGRRAGLGGPQPQAAHCPHRIDSGGRAGGARTEAQYPSWGPVTAWPVGEAPAGPALRRRARRVTCWCAKGWWSLGGGAAEARPARRAARCRDQPPQRGLDRGLQGSLPYAGWEVLLSADGSGCAHALSAGLRRAAVGEERRGPACFEQALS